MHKCLTSDLHNKKTLPSNTPDQIILITQSVLTISILIMVIPSLFLFLDGETSNENSINVELYPKEDIYEAYYSKTMFGSFLGYATITVRRTEGSTSSFFATGMTNSGEITGSINALVRDLKKSPKQNFVNVNAHPSLADELQKLVELKNQGLLTEEEFNAQKQKLIG